MESKIENTFLHVNKNWKEEYYHDCIKEWNELKEFISDEKTTTTYTCEGCNTHWKSIKFIYDKIFCCKCDQSIQPFLSNPINFKYVVEYIDSKYWKYIFPIYSIFNELDDPKDIFNHININNIPLEDGNILISYKEKCEYGTSLKIFHALLGKIIVNIFISNIEKYHITTFTFHNLDSDQVDGLSEKIYSNRTEYYFNGVHQTDVDKVDIVIKYINNQFDQLKDYCEKLYNFLYSSDTFEILYLDDIDNLEENFYSELVDVTICDICRKFISKEDCCDFCDIKFCDNCIPDEISFHTCDTCHKTICYTNTKYTDYKCQKTRFNGSCIDCGN